MGGRNDIARGLAWRQPRATGKADIDGGRLSLSQESVAHDDGARQSLYGANGKICAWVTPDGCLCKQVDGSRHFLRQPAGITFDAAILQQAQDLGAVRVWVRDRETGATYRATLDAFAEHGIQLDRGYGAQTCLPFTFWKSEQPGEPTQPTLF